MVEESPRRARYSTAKLHTRTETNSVKLCGHELIDLGEKMPVAVARKGDRSVSSSSSDLGGVYAREGKQSDPGVLQVVGTQQFQTGSRDGWSPIPATPIIRSDRSFSTRTKYVAGARLSF
jgi:hypothetical protein